VDVTILDGDATEHVDSVRALFLEYASSLGFSLCFQNFDQELATLPGHYQRPEGRLLLARVRDSDIGCVALRRLEPQICEMKRLYVQPSMREHGVGRLLAAAAISAARDIGYTAMRLDTVEVLMREAVQLYRQLGFRPIGPYIANPLAGALYMELDLASRTRNQEPGTQNPQH